MGWKAARRVITVACVRTGTKFPVQYVERLRNMVARHLPAEHRFVCLTDQDDKIGGVGLIRIEGLRGWWGKMALFSPELRAFERCIYLDLDTVIVGDLTPFAEYDGPFAICQNFTQLAGHATWPCKYGSCAMSFPVGWGVDVWDRFKKFEAQVIEDNPHGDQEAIETLVPDAVFLQDVLPEGFFLNKRALMDNRHKSPPGASVVVFGGSQRPHNSDIGWIREAWQ